MMRHSGSRSKLSGRDGGASDEAQSNLGACTKAVTATTEQYTQDCAAGASVKSVQMLGITSSILQIDSFQEDITRLSEASGLLNTPARPHRSMTPRRLLSAAEAAETFPDLVAERPFIMGGYRQACSLYHCTMSVFLMHNETGNIWTHLLGASAFTALALCYGILPQLFPECTLTRADCLALSAYLCGAIFCLATSTAFHTFCCCSQEAFHRYKRLDHIGVLGLMAASDIPMIHFGFYHHPYLRALYLALASALLVLAALILLSARLRAAKYMPLRVGVFCALAVVGWTHMAHEISLKGGLSTHEGRMSFRCWMLPFSAYITGVVILLSRMPERFRPGLFDIWGHSHQLWHFFVLLGASLQWWSVLMYLRIAKGLPVA